MSRSKIWISIITLVLCFAISTFAQQSDSLSSNDQLSASPCLSITSDGTALANQVTKFTSPCNLEGSKITDNGTTTSISELVTLPSKGAATATAGKTSQALNWTSSVFNSTTATAVPQNFRLQAEPINNDKTNASATLNLLFGQGTAAPAETGLRIASNGLINFVAGQTFPGTGTVTSVGSGAGLIGGPITTSGTISIANHGVSNAMLQNSSVTVNVGAGLTGGGVIPLGGSTTISLNGTTTVGNSASNTSSTSLGSWSVVAQSNPVQVSGVYYVNATSLVYVDSADAAVYCFVTTASNGLNPDGLWGGGSVAGHYQQASVSDTWFVVAGDLIQMACESNTNDASSFANNASLTATLISSSFDAKAAKARQASLRQNRRSAALVPRNPQAPPF